MPPPEKPVRDVVGGVSAAGGGLIWFRVGECAIIIRPNDDSWIVLGRSVRCRDYIEIREQKTRPHQFLSLSEFDEHVEKKSLIYICN